MPILVQRKFVVAPADRAEFERQSREGLWPAFLEYGAQMVAYGSWEFGGGLDDGVVTHTVYEGFEHWEATRRDRAGHVGSFHVDPFVAPLARPHLAIAAGRGALVQGSEARLVELASDIGSIAVHHRRDGTPPAPLPPTFGRGSVVSERTYSLRDGAHGEFLRLSQEHVWPWLESRGARVVAFGQDPLLPSDEVITLFAFRSLEEWHRLSRPSSALHPPSDVLQAWNQRASLVRTHRGRILQVQTDFGQLV